MKLPVLITFLILSTPPGVPSALLQVTLASPPACSGPMGQRPVGSVPLSKAQAAAEFRVSLCDGRKVDLRTEVARDGDAFEVVAINRADSSSTGSFLMPGQSFDAVLNNVRLRFTLVDPSAPAPAAVAAPDADR